MLVKLLKTLFDFSKSEQRGIMLVCFFLLVYIAWNTTVADPFTGNEPVDEVFRQELLAFRHSLEPAGERAASGKASAGVKLFMKNSAVPAPWDTDDRRGNYSGDFPSRADFAGYCYRLGLTGKQVNAILAYLDTGNESYGKLQSDKKGKAIRNSLQAGSRVQGTRYHGSKQTVNREQGIRYDGAKQTEQREQGIRYDGAKQTEQREQGIRYDASEGAPPGDRQEPGNYRQNHIPLLELNTATAEQLRSLYGIGPVFSTRIIKYRNLLGGFVRLSQLKEVYGLEDSTYRQVREKLSIDSSLVDKINLNSVGFKTLLRHPYLNYQEAKSILTYRDYKKGRIGSIDEISSEGVIQGSRLKKIRPYLSVNE